MNEKSWSREEVLQLRGAWSSESLEGDAEAVAIADRAVQLYRKKLLGEGSHLTPHYLNHLLSNVDGWSSHFGNMLRGHLEALGAEVKDLRLQVQEEVARSFRVSEELEEAYRERDAARTEVEEHARRRHALIAAGAALDERLAVVEADRDGWRGLALRLLVLVVMARAQWERYVLAADHYAQGCPGPGKCHGSLAWCDRCGDVKLLCNMGGRCDTHRDRWIEHLLESRPSFIGTVFDHGVSKGARESRAESRAQLETMARNLGTAQRELNASDAALWSMDMPPARDASRPPVEDWKQALHAAGFTMALCLRLQEQPTISQDKEAQKVLGKCAAQLERIREVMARMQDPEALAQVRSQRAADLAAVSQGLLEVFRPAREYALGKPLRVHVTVRVDGRQWQGALGDEALMALDRINLESPR